MSESTSSGSTGPQRTCVGCRQVVPARELRRYVLREGTVVPDPDRRLSGRGAWLHDDPQCLAAAVRRGGFARSFRGRADAAGLTEAE